MDAREELPTPGSRSELRHSVSLNVEHECQKELKHMLRSMEHKLDTLSALIHARLPAGATPHNPHVQQLEPLVNTDSTGASSWTHSQIRKRMSSRRSSVMSSGTSGQRRSRVLPRPGYGRSGSESQSSRSLSSSSAVRWRSRHSFRGKTIESSTHGSPTCFSALNPDSLSRIAFDLLSICLLLYDAFVMPYQLAWNAGVDETSLMAMRWATSSFWTLDLLINLVTGFRNKEAELILDLRKSMQNYIRTWFIFDLTLVICDWATALNQTGDQWRWMQGMRVIRLLRTGRQVLRARTLVLKAKLMIQTKGVHLAIDICLLLLILLWVNHMVCCGWYSIGRYSQPDTGVTWLTNSEYSSGGPYYDYLTAYHWAITQMTPGSMEVFPASSSERLYSVATVFFGLILGSSLIATLTSMMTQYKMRLEASSRKFAQLNQFLVQRRAPPELALAIKLQVKGRSSDVGQLKQKDVEYLSLVSKSLQEVLWHSWCMQNISIHNFLNLLNLFDPIAMQTLCNSAIEAREFAIYDAIFEEGASGSHMYFLVSGSLHYDPGELAPEAALMMGDPNLNLRPGDWCSEPALWTMWTHLGTLEVCSHAEVFCVDGTSLPYALPRFPGAAAILSEYSASFLKYVNEPGTARGDLSHGYNLNELAWGLSPDTRLQLAEPVIHRLSARPWAPGLNPKTALKLTEEVTSGKCSLSYEGSEPIRNTFVAALRLWGPGDYNGAFLVKVAEVLREGGEIVPSCLLPAVKRNWGESHTSALQRILTQDLPEIASEVEVHDIDESIQESFMGTSPSYGVQTRYTRAIFDADLAASAELPQRKAGGPSWMVGESGGLLSCFKRLRPAANNTAASVQPNIIAVLATHKHAVVLRCDAKNRASRKIYLWLRQCEFDTLAHELAKPLIKLWVTSLEHDPLRLTPPMARTASPLIQA